MKKNGFVLLETLIATTLIVFVFTVIYIEFGVVNENYKASYNNNTVEKLYATNNIKNFILSNGYNTLIPFDGYLDVTSCSSFSSNSQCSNLISTLKVKQVILLKDNLKDIKESMLEDTTISDNFKKFIKNSSYNSISNGYRLMVEYEDNQCASIRMW